VYDATLAGLTYKVDATVRGLLFTAEGPDQTLPAFALRVAQAARRYDPITAPPAGSGRQFEGSLGSKESYQNLRERPYFTREAYAAAMGAASLATTAAYAEAIWRGPCNVQALLQGNLNRADADVLFKGLQTALAWQGGVLPWADRSTKRLRLVPTVPQALALLAAGSGAVADPLPPAEAAAAAAAAAGLYPTLARTQSDPSNVNSEVAITWQIPATSPAYTDLFLSYASSTNASAAAATGLPTPSEMLLATANVFAKVIKEPFVNALRTQQQIGYLVGSELRITDGVASFELIAKSAQYGTSDIQARMAAFVASVETTVLGKLTSADVEALTNMFAVRDKELLSQVQLRALLFAPARFFSCAFDAESVPWLAWFCAWRIPTGVPALRRVGERHAAVGPGRPRRCGPSTRRQGQAGGVLSALRGAKQLGTPGSRFARVRFNAAFGGANVGVYTAFTFSPLF
jgi:hypothetical protein